jgi:biotin carboxylase
MTETMMLVGAGFMGRGYVAAARDLGVRTVLLDEELWRGDHEKDVHRFLTPEGTAESQWLEAALAAADAHRPSGALPFSEPHVLAAARVQDRWGLPGPSLAAAEASRNKAVQRALFARAGLPQPAFTVANSAESAATWARGRYPVVVKPLRGSGSAGVRRVADEAALLADLARRDLGQEVLVESFSDAPEFSWEGLVRDGEVLFGNYTCKTTTGPPEFVELEHRLPWFSGGAGERLDPQMAALVAAAGIRTGLVHLEFRDDAGTALPMEFAVRTPGDHIMELMCLAYRHDFFASAIELALGREVRLPAGAARAAGVVFVSAPRPGRIAAVDAAAADRPEVVRFGQKRHAGDEVGGLRSSGDRVGYALLAAEDAGTVAAAAAAVRAGVQVEMAPEEPSALAEGPVVVVCKWRPEIIAAALEATAHLILVLDEDDQSKADDAVCAAARAVYRIGSLDSIEEVTGVAVDLAVRGVRPDRVLCFAEDGQLGAGRLRSLLGLGGSGGPLVDAAIRDKRMMKHLVAAAGVPVPEWWSLPVGAGLADEERIGFPAVVKPAYGFGTMRTTRVEDATALRKALADGGSERLHSRHLIAERFVEGRELHVDALWSGGKPLFLTVSAYHAPRLEMLDAGGRGPRDGSVILPPEEHPELYERVTAMNAAVCGALAIEDAATHMEAFETPAGALVFSEIATRLGGGWIPSMLSAHLGADVHRVVLDGILFGHGRTAVPARKHIGALHLRPEQAGTITRMPDDEAIRAVPGVLDWKRLKQTGDTFGLDHAMDWCLVVVFGADTAEGLEAAARRVEEQLRIEVEAI